MLKVKVSPPLRVSDRFAILTLQIFRSGLCRASALLRIYVLLFSEILQPKTGQNENKSSKNPGGGETDCRALSLTAIKIFLCGRKPIIYSGLAVLLVESDFSKLSMLDFDELMN